MSDPLRIVNYLRNADDGFVSALSRCTTTELQRLIDRADSAYYRSGHTQILADHEYDSLKTALKSIDPDDERLTRVGYQFDPEEIGNKLCHRSPMGSLDNTDDGIVGFSPWLESVQEKLDLASSPPVMVSLKVDGGSVCASYKAGKLVSVATRGNGEEGEDITANAIQFRNLPTTLPIVADIDVRGEAVLYVSDYRDIRSRELGLPFFEIPESERSNPRNIGNGILGRHDGKDSDKIEFLAFNLVVFDQAAAIGLDFKNEQEKFEALTSLGFKTVPGQVCQTPKDVDDYYMSALADRDQKVFEIDGLVVVLCEKKHQDYFVTDDPKTKLRPKHSRAIKFPHKFNTTILKDVTVTVGHTGMVIPTAVLEEVRIGGVNVSNALLNNYEEIKRLDLAIGDEVTVVLSGDIIPKIIGKIKDGHGRVPITEPLVCPVCQAATTRLLRGKPGACTYCTNQRCPAAVFAKLDCWIGSSKKGVGILDIGDNMIKALWDQGILATPADLYKLTVDSIKNISIGKGIRIGTSRAEKIINNISSKKRLPLHIFLGSLGIELLGRRRVLVLKEAAAGRLDRLEDWTDFDKLRTIQLPGFGDAIRAAVVQGVEDNLQLINDLLANGVSIDYDCDNVQVVASVQSSDRPFAGKQFCFTGTRELLKEVEAAGGIIKSGVSKGLHYLVQADPLSTTNKTKKAEEYGVQVISVEHLRQALSGNTPL